MTLTELSYQSRIIVKLGLIFVGGSVVFYLMMMLMMQMLKKPDTEVVVFKPAFGKLEQPVFEEALSPRKLNFVLDTVDGTLPQTTASGQVFFIPEKQATLLYLTKAIALAQSFGIDTTVHPQETIDDTWVKFSSVVDELKVNTKYFHFTYGMKASIALQELIETTPSAKFTQFEDKFLQFAKDEMMLRGAYTADIAAGKTNIVYLRYNLATKQFYPITAEEVPQAVRIDFFRKDESLSIVAPKYYESQNYVILAPLVADSKVIEMQYKSYEKLVESPGAYPLLTATEAWDLLTKNMAGMVSLGESATDTIHIKQVFLAYYDPESYQKYFQPVFVFLGDQNYVGYVSAIKPEYLLQGNTTE